MMKPLYTLQNIVSICGTDKLQVHMHTVQPRTSSYLRGEGPEAPKEKQLDHTIERYRLLTLSAWVIS